MASLNLLFVHEVSYEKKPIFEMHEFPEHLAARGHKVTFLQFDEGYKFWREKRQPTEKTISGRVLPDTSIKIVTPHQFGIPGVDRLYATLSVWPQLDRLLKSEKFDAIVLYAVPTYGHQVIRLAKKYGVPVIFRALDVSHLIRKSFLSPLIKSAEKYVYKHADVLSANNPELAKYCAVEGCRRVNTFVALPPLDVTYFREPSREVAAQGQTLRQQLNIRDDDKVIFYLGTFFYFSGLGSVIKSLASAVVEHPNLKLLLVGGGEQSDYLKRLVESLGLESRVVFPGFVPYSALPEYFALADVAINPMETVTQASLALPHKVLQYLAAEKPVVTTRLAGLASIVGNDPNVFWVDDPRQIITESIEVLSRQRSGLPTNMFEFERAVDTFLTQIEIAVELKAPSSHF